MDVLPLFDYLRSISKHPWGRRRDQEPIRSCHSIPSPDNVWTCVTHVYKTFARRCLRIVGWMDGRQGRVLSSSLIVLSNPDVLLILEVSMLKI